MLSTLRPASCALIGALVTGGLTLPAQATLIDVATGQPLVKAATANLLAEGVKLAKQGGVDIIAAAAGEAWTWDYAYAFPREDQRNDTTLDINLPPPIDIQDQNPNPLTAEAFAQASGLFGRKAAAHGRADLPTNTLLTETSTNRLAVAKSIAGIGAEYQTAGARLGALVLAKIGKIALDPPIWPLDLPGPTILEPLPSPPDPTRPQTTMPLAPNETSPAGFDLVIGYFDPFGIENILLDLTGRLVFDALAQKWGVAITPSFVTPGTSGLPQAEAFDCTSGGGSVECVYQPHSDVSIAIPFTVQSAWLDDSSFRLFSRVGVFAQSVDVAEPGSVGLVMFGLALVWRRGRIRQFVRTPPGTLAPAS